MNSHIWFRNGQRNLFLPRCAAPSHRSDLAVQIDFVYLSRKEKLLLDKVRSNDFICPADDESCYLAGIGAYR